MLDDFLLRAALAGVGVVLASGPLGSVVVWRRMAYFGDATAHATVLGVALALGFSGSVYLGSMAAALAMGIAVHAISGRGLAPDTALGVLAHSALALGLVAISFVDGVRVDLVGFLFGDILAVQRGDLLVIWLGALAVNGLLIWRWQALLIATLNRDLAFASGYNPRREELLLTLALALMVAVAIKVVGALLIGALLIIPAAAARTLSRTPEQMAVGAILVGLAAVLAGLWAALRFDTPAGPGIVVAAATAFVGTLIVAKIKG